MEARRAPEIMAELEPPAFRHVQRIDERIEQRDVAEAETIIAEARATHGLDREQQHFGVGGGLVGRAKALDPRLAELARVRRAGAQRLKAEGRTVVAIAGFRPGLRVTLEIEPRHRHRQIGPEAQLLAREIGEDVRPAAHLFADLIEKYAGRLQNRGRDEFVARAPEQSHQVPGLAFEGLECFGRFRGHDLRPRTGRGLCARPRRDRPQARGTAPRPASSDIPRDPRFL